MRQVDLARYMSSRSLHRHDACVQAAAAAAAAAEAEAATREACSEVEEVAAKVVGMAVVDAAKMGGQQPNLARV